jgi:hypothetical protein
MSKATLSVTNVPCKCGFPQNAAEDKSFPVRFDPEFNEYYFDHTLSPGDTLSIRLSHCPVCGGVTAKSKRAESFVELSDDEMKRIHEQAGSYKSAKEIEHALGAPDIEEQGNQNAGTLRVLTYKNLSDKADVRFTVYKDGRIEGAIAPKYVGPRPERSVSSKRRKKN